MNLRAIRDIFSKEILSTLRDRRAIVSSLLIPLLLLPVFMLGLPFVLGGLFEREQVTITDVGIMGEANLPEGLQERLVAENLRLVPTDDPQRDVEANIFQVALTVPEDFLGALETTAPAEITLYSKVGNLRSELNASKVRNAISEFENSIVADRLTAAGLDTTILTPITTRSVDASSEAERQSGQFAWLIPFFIAIWTLAGGQMTAIDATAGEKERGTLEALLVTPVRRVDMVLGKFFATLFFGLLSASMAILGYVIAGGLLRQFFSSQLGDDGNALVTVLGGSFQIDIVTILLLLVSAFLLAALVAALLMSITMFARSFKEAQTYIAPLSFILVFPAIGLQFADFFSANLYIYLVPILNALLLMDDIVKGTVAPLPLALTWGSLIALSALLLDFAYRNFKREGVIFRT